MSDQDDLENESTEPQDSDSGTEPSDSGKESIDIIQEATEGDGPDPIDNSHASPDLGLILDIPVTLSLELGSTEIGIGDLLRLNKGSIVELEKEASEPLDVKVNGTLIAYAEVVVINDRYGIRLIDVVSESERIKKLS